MSNTINAGRPWTRGQIKTLYHGAKKQWGAARIANNLKRPIGAVRQKANSLSLSLETRKKGGKGTGTSHRRKMSPRRPSQARAHGM